MTPTIPEGFTPWAGGENPAPGSRVRVVWGDGTISPEHGYRSGDLVWTAPTPPGVSEYDIIAYRVVEAPHV